MELVVRAFPVLAGQEARLNEFANAVEGARASEAEDFFRRMGVARESWFRQQTDAGQTWVIIVTQISGSATAEDFRGSQDAFDRWFKEQVKLISGVDPEKQPLGPPTTCIFDTARKV